MEFGAQQREALEAIRDWLDDVEQGASNKVFRLFGYAGTGKTTLAKHIGDAVAVGERDEQSGLLVVPQYAAYTGKAAVVMKRKGCENARTLHSLIYTSHDKSREQLFDLERQFAAATVEGTPQDKALIEKLAQAIADEKDALSQPGFALKPDALTVRRWDEDEHTSVPLYRIKMFIIDECSMVDARLGQDLLSFNVPVLVLGDPAQLPPVGSGGYFTKQQPDFLLTDIHRQAEGDPIISLASTIRSGGSLERGVYGDSRVCTKVDMQQDEWLDADQILCGLNRTRDLINKRCRELLGFKDVLPEPGEKLVCLKNNSDDELLNGSLWECTESIDNGGTENFTLKAKSLDDEARNVCVVVNKSKFLGLDGDLYEARRTNSFDFGYALTVHKAQGSQWDRVILMDEWSREYRKEWLYTGITRAAKSITVVQK